MRLESKIRSQALQLLQKIEWKKFQKQNYYKNLSIPKNKLFQFDDFPMNFREQQKCWTSHFILFVGYF